MTGKTVKSGNSKNTRPQGSVSNSVIEQQKIVDIRREYVARMVLEHLTVREMAVALTKLDDPIKSPDRKDGIWSPATIQRDIDALRAQWREHALADTIEYKAQQLAEIAHAKRKAYAKDDLNVIARLIRLEAEITGTLAVYGNNGPNWREIAESMGLDPEKLLAFARSQQEQQMALEVQAGSSAQRVIDVPVHPNGQDD